MTERRKIKQIIKIVSKISVASLSIIICGIIRTKVYAILLGTYGVGISSQLLNFNALIYSIGTIGIPLALTRYVSEWERDGKWDEIKDAMARLISMLFLLGVFLFIITFIFSKKVSFLILDSDSFYLLLVIIAFSFPFSGITTVFEASIKGLKKFTQYVKITVLISISVLCISVISVWFYGIKGVALSLTISSVFSMAIYFYYFNKNKFFCFKDFFRIKLSISKPLKLILQVGLASLILGFVDQITLLSIRSNIVRYLGVDSNGIYQTIFSISSNYLNLFFMSLAVYALPILSEMKGFEDINDEINNIYKFSLLLIFPIISIFFVLREQAIFILFSSQFNSAQDYFIYNFIGDFFKALSWVLGAWLIPRSKVKLWLILGIIYNILYFLVFFTLLNLLFNDLKSVVIAYAFSNFFHFIINLYFIKKLNYFKFKTDVTKLMLISTFCLFFILIISNLNKTLGYIFLIPIILSWLFLSVKKEELLKFFKLIKIT